VVALPSTRGLDLVGQPLIGLPPSLPLSRIRDARTRADQHEALDAIAERQGNVQRDPTTH
jgi:hypothetical protein